MRGRNSAAPLNKFGLCVARKTSGAVKVTELGKYFISPDCDLQKLFLYHFLKWQLPNKMSRRFSEEDGFAIKPFIAILHLISKVNRDWKELGNKPVGISKKEFSLFAMTLINYKNIAKQAKLLIDYRTALSSVSYDKDKSKVDKEFSEQLARTFLVTANSHKVNKFLNNLQDYSDNAIRYFRMTGYLYIRGNGYYIDLEPRRSVEITELLNVDDASPIEFQNVDQYLSYLSDIKLPILPWETRKVLVQIAKEAVRDIQYLRDKLQEKVAQSLKLNFQLVDSMNSSQLKNYIDDLRNQRHKLQNLELQLNSQNEKKIEEYISTLQNIHSFPQKRGVELERLVTLALIALNDAIDIKPNYPVGDDNEPTFTAPAGQPDIECFYKHFNVVCEVTMLKDRTQWYNEGQPVMRHVRDFENLHVDKQAYCLFIAPRMHKDTMETFWMAVTNAYRGKPQKIVPLSIAQLAHILEVLLEIKKKRGNFLHEYLMNLYEQILEITSHVDSSDKWIDKIPSAIEKWKISILSSLP